MAEHYGRVTWLFVSRNFKDDAKDREAARTHDRFGITSWPQLVLFDPRDDRVLADMPRGFDAWVQRLQPFVDAVPKPASGAKAALAQLAQATKAAAAGDAKQAVELAERVAAREDGAGAWLGARELLRSLRGDPRPPAERLQDPDVRERALAIEALGDDATAEPDAWVGPVSARVLDGTEHIVVRLRALAWLAKHRPQPIVEHAATLLRVPNDAFRNLVLAQVAASPEPSPSLAPLLADLFANAGGTVPSRNPNVLRMHVAQCLVGSGDAAAIDALAPVVREANARNGTTKLAVQALGAIAARAAAADRRRAVELLFESLPPALPAAAPAADVRLATALLREHREALAAATGAALPELPEGWQAADREAFVQAARRAARR